MKQTIKISTFYLLASIFLLATVCINKTSVVTAAPDLGYLPGIVGDDSKYQIPASFNVDGTLSINSNVEITKSISSSGQKVYIKINMPKSGRLELAVTNKNNSGVSKNCRVIVFKEGASSIYGSGYISSVGLPYAKKFYLYLYQGTYYVELTGENDCYGFNVGVKANATYTDTNYSKSIESYITAPSISISTQKAFIVPYGAYRSVYKFTLKEKSKVTVSGTNDSFSNICYRLDKDIDTYKDMYGMSRAAYYSGYIKEPKTYELEKGTYYFALYTGKYVDGYSLDNAYGGYCKINIKATPIVSKVKIYSKKKFKKYYEPGAKIQLKAKIYPQKFKNKKIKWTSSDKSVATVTKKGLVKIKSPGWVSIYATVDNVRVSKSFTIREHKQKIKSITSTYDYTPYGTSDYDLNITLNSNHDDLNSKYEYWISTNKKRWKLAFGESSESYVNGKKVYRVCSDIQKPGTYYLKIRRVTLERESDHPIYSEWSNIKKFVIK